MPKENDSAGAGISSKYSSYLPEVYAGHPNRIQRYYQYDDMDRDSDINAALDTIADFCTQSEEQNDEPLRIVYRGEANETEVKLLKTLMDKWVAKNDFRSRLWHIFRNTIKNGDAFFLRDPETGEWLWVDHYSMLMVKVDEEQGKEPAEYIVKGIDYNKKNKFATKQIDPTAYTPFASQQVYSRAAGMASPTGGSFQLPGAHVDQRAQRLNQQQTSEIQAIDAKHVVHLSLSVGMDVNWPFGQSVLESVFKTFKQKELLEDSIIIYRVQRAPERRVFKIDVGTMPPVRAMAHIQAIKNEIHQRRIPNRTGGGSSILDAAYNPLAIMDDYFFAQTSEGRGSSVETLPGGDSLGEIGDLTFFTSKMARGLRIPPSYLGLDGQDSGGGPQYSDGKLGAAMIQEFRFNKYCMRLQSLLAPVFDAEFKLFVQASGVNVDPSIYDIQFNPPQNFTKYRQMEVDAAQAAVYSQVADNKKLSERFKLRRFLNLTEEELLENERLWAEENSAKLKKTTGQTPADTEQSGDLSSIGMRGGEQDFGFDLGATDLGGDDLGDMGGDPGAGGDAPPAGGPVGGAAPPPSAAPPAQ